MVNNTQYLTGGKSPNPLEPPSNFLASPGNAKVTLTWTDPPNATVEPSGQTYATWAYTQVVRKEGSQPTGPHDGIVVVQSSVRDQYATSGFVDTGLTNDTLYYYGAFAYNSDKVVSEGAFVSATPKAGTSLGDLAEGTVITINVSGAPIEFFLAKLDYEPTLNGTGRELILQKNGYDKTAWQQRGNPPSWANSEILAWLNSTFKARLSNFVQSMAGSTKYDISMYYNQTDTFESSIFTVSLWEIGLQEDETINIGTPFNTRGIVRPCTYEGNYVPYWTRDVNQGTIYGAGLADTLGSASYSGNYSPYTNQNIVRPCFTLPSTALVDSNLALIETA